MARIFPQITPQNTGSNQAEPDIYWRLKKQLPDDFVVIHSLPWLASVAKEIDGRSVPTGEIATKYRAKWCPDLVNRIDEKSWRNTVAHAINSWFGRGILEKIDKGIYKRK